MFATNDEKGLYWRLYGWRVHGEIEAHGPLPDSFLIENLNMCVRVSRFDGHHEEQLQKRYWLFYRYASRWDVVSVYTTAPTRSHSARYQQGQCQRVQGWP